MEEMTYHKEGDYLIPDMKPEPLADELRFWGEQYIKYKRKSNRAWVVCHKMNGTLLPLAIEVQKSAEEMEKKETERLMKKYEVTTELHNNNPLEWVARMNKIKAEVGSMIMEEIMYHYSIYSIPSF